MKISDAIATLLREMNARGDVDVKIETPSDFCEAHKVHQPCPYCDLCAHGKMRTQDCRECHVNDDQSWRDAPVSDKELDDILKHHGGSRCWPMIRSTPHRIRNYVVDEVALMPRIVSELRAFRSASAKPVDAVDPHAGIRES